MTVTVLGCSDRLRGRLAFPPLFPRPSRGLTCLTRLRASGCRRTARSGRYEVAEASPSRTRPLGGRTAWTLGLGRAERGELRTRPRRRSLHVLHRIRMTVTVFGCSDRLRGRSPLVSVPPAEPGALLFDAPSRVQGSAANARLGGLNVGQWRSSTTTREGASDSLAPGLAGGTR